MRSVRIAALISCVLYSTLTAPGQGAYVTVGGQSRQAAAKSYNRGRFAARRDRIQGRLRIRTFGLPSDEACYGQMLKDELGIELDWVGGCVVRPSVVNEASGYNSVMIPAIEKKFGKGTLEDLAKRATKCARFELVRWDYSPNFTLPIPTLPLPSPDLPIPPPPPNTNHESRCHGQPRTISC